MQINYYDNKGKNLFVMFSVFTVLIFNMLNWLISVYNPDTQKFLFSHLIKYYFSNISWLLLFFLPHILLLIYALTIFTGFKIKNWLLSIYFLSLSVYSVILLYKQISSLLEYSDSFIMYEMYSEAIIGSLLVLSLFCLFIGTINNFALKNFLKIGAIFQGLYGIFIVISTFASLITTGKILINRNETFHTILFFYTHNIISLLLILSYVYFFASLVFLTRKEPLVEANTIQE